VSDRSNEDADECKRLTTSCRLKLILEPLAIAKNVTQANYTRLDHVLLTLRNLYETYSMMTLEQPIRDAVIDSLEKRWAAADQDVFILHKPIRGSEVDALQTSTPSLHPFHPLLHSLVAATPIALKSVLRIYSTTGKSTTTWISTKLQRSKTYKLKQRILSRCLRRNETVTPSAT